MIKQRSKEWFEQRKGRITGSNVGAILGVNPYKTDDDVMREMVREYHGAEREFKGNVATEYGTFHESGAMFDYELETGRHIEECGFYPFSDWLGASPDGLIDLDGLVEIKCPYSGNVDRKLKEDLPYYYAQTQIEMYCADREWCDFYQWSPEKTTLERVYINEAWLDENLPKLKAFYEKFLKELEAPQKHLEPKRKEIDALQLVQEFDDLQEAIERATERKKEVLAEIVAKAGSANALVNGRNLTKVEKQGAISYAKIVKEHLPLLNLEPYRGKSSEYWVLK